MSKSVTPDQIAAAINRELTLYGENVIVGVKKEAKRSMNQLVKDTRASAPVDRGVYQKSITSKKMAENNRSVSYVWYVAGSAYRLSHLLEKGHANRDGGRTPGTHFIRNASDPILRDYIQAIEEVIRNG